MKKILLLLVITVVAVSCKNETKKTVENNTVKEIKKESFPEELGKVFEKHGGIDTWRNAKVLSFNKGEETITSDLQSRKIVISSPKYSLGFDGKTVWLDEAEEGTFKGNPSFYSNLYFYFYAMPFVLSDDGITYEKTADLVFEGVNYPGFKISFKADKGSSPDDNYKLYYNPETYQMEWLAYTATFNSKKPSDNFNIIRYNNWNTVNGLVLPKAITWYKKDENSVPTEPARPATEFTLPLISKAKLADSFYEKPVK